MEQIIKMTTPKPLIELIREIATGDDMKVQPMTFYKWIVRRKIPIARQVEIVKRTNGRINFEDMETLDFVPNSKGQGND